MSPDVTILKSCVRQWSLKPRLKVKGRIEHTKTQLNLVLTSHSGVYITYFISSGTFSVAPDSILTGP